MYRPKLTSLFFIIIFVVTSLLGCQQNVPADSAQNGITIVIPEDPPSFNPIIADTGYDALVMELVMLGLSDVDPEGKVFPELAKELPTIENGGVVMDEDAGRMTVTWKMREDVQWADGTPVTADDVIFTYESIINPETGGWIPGIDYIDSVEKVDDHSFTISYNSIYPGYLTQFGGEQVVIWPAHYCDASQGFASWEYARKPLSNGPFVLAEWVNGDHVTFVKNEKYFEQGKPDIDTVTIRIIPEQSVRKTMPINGDADLDMWTNEQMVSDLQGEANVSVDPSPTNRWVMRSFFNLAAKGTTDPVATPHPILSDLRVRQAIRAAIDVDTISKEFFLQERTGRHNHSRLHRDHPEILTNPDIQNDDGRARIDKRLPLIIFQHKEQENPRIKNPIAIIEKIIQTNRINDKILLHSFPIVPVILFPRYPAHDQYIFIRKIQFE